LIDEQPDVFRPLPRARGLGCHSSKAAALSRSITAAAQSRLTNIAGSCDGISASGLSRASNVESWEAAMQQHTHPAQERNYGRLPSFQFDDFLEEKNWLVHSLDKAGFGQGVVVDLSKPGWPICVARVVAPGLLHVDPAGPNGGVS
jgi:ribosomal protein S12 methylthiotransferase accessory factor YcaO